MKQFVPSGDWTRAASSLIGTGDVTDDDILQRNMGDVALGMVNRASLLGMLTTVALNKTYVDAFKKANNGLRPNFMSVGGYDGMHALYEGLKKTNGNGGEALVEAMKGHVKWDQPAWSNVD